ncbi:hypothetical protein ACA910_014913 [Epithemia clementina (nom. ined.)]
MMTITITRHQQSRTFRKDVPAYPRVHLPTLVWICLSFLLFVQQGVECSSAAAAAAAAKSSSAPSSSSSPTIFLSDERGRRSTTLVRGGDVMDREPVTVVRPSMPPTTSSGARYGGTFQSSNSGNQYYPYRPSSSSSSYQYGGSRSSWSSYPRTTTSANNNSNNNNMKSFNKQTRDFFQPFTDWWTTNISPTIKNWPKIHCRVEPTTTLKIRKTFRPLKTIVQVGADFNTQLSVWQFKSSWEDALIGGKLTLAGRELQFTKSWQLSVGAMGDLVTRLKLRAAVDLQTWKAYARIGFRTERLAPINVMEGFTVMKQIPLDGTKGHVKLEVKANFALPEPEIEYSTEIQRSVIGMGDIEINIDELNLLLDY